jgi:hypothetical protein
MGLPVPASAILTPLESGHLCISQFHSRLNVCLRASLMFHANLNILADIPFADCSIPNYILTVFPVLLYSSSSALFFIRLKAVYCNNRIITIFFGFLWFVLFGLFFLMPLSTKSMHIPTTQICFIFQIEHYVALPFVAHFVFNNLVFIAISLRIVSISLDGGTFSACMKSFFRGDGLSRLPRSLLYGGQLYYRSVI